MAGKKTDAKAAMPEVVKEDKPKVYRFTSENKYLSCVGLGIQFDNGKAQTTDLAVARALARIEGVKLVEE